MRASSNIGALKDRLAAVRKELRTLGKKKYLEKRRSNNHGLTDWMVKLVMATYVLSDYDTDIAEIVGQLLRSKLPVKTRQKHPDSVTPVKDWFISLSDNFADSIVNPADKKDEHLRRGAFKMISEIRTVRWVRDQNFEKGIAPASDAVAAKFSEKMNAVGEGSATDALVQSASSGTKNGQRTLRRWARKFRRRWGVSNTHLACLDSPGRAALRGKVGASVWNPFQGVAWEAQSDREASNSRPAKFPESVKLLPKKRFRFLVPKLGPDSGPYNRIPFMGAIRGSKFWRRKRARIWNREVSLGPGIPASSVPLLCPKCLASGHGATGCVSRR